MLHRSLAVVIWAAAAATALLVVMMSSPACARDLPDAYANVTPMPGGVIAIDSCGNPDGLGAVQVNIPVAYTPKSGNILAWGAVGGTRRDKGSFGNKTGAFGTSIGGYPRLWISGMLANNGEATANAQLLVVQEKTNVPSVSLGVQNFAKSKFVERWGYVVATKGFCFSGQRLYLTAGARGNSDFARGIAGLSAPLGGSFNAAMEWDGFQMNTGVTYRPGGQKGNVTLLGGYNGHAGWLAGLGVYLKLPGLGI